ncbi:hypothetical protein RRG08_058115, partial [Elysia crispata]
GVINVEKNFILLGQIRPHGSPIYCHRNEHIGLYADFRVPDNVSPIRFSWLKVTFSPRGYNWRKNIHIMSRIRPEYGTYEDLEWNNFSKTYYL